MIWHATALPGVLIGQSQRHADERGWFGRVYCRQTFAGLGIDFQPTQISVSWNRVAGTLRGMHFQIAPHAERKLIRCTAGAVCDVLVDLRADGATFRQWLAVTLSEADGNAVFVPAGIAHGFLTLTDAAGLEYMIDVPYASDCARGVRWNDPAFGIRWPGEPVVISERDRCWPDHAG